MGSNTSRLGHPNQPSPRRQSSTPSRPMTDGQDPIPSLTAPSTTDMDVDVRSLSAAQPAESLSSIGQTITRRRARAVSSATNATTRHGPSSTLAGLRDRGSSLFGRRDDDGGGEDGTGGESYRKDKKRRRLSDLLSVRGGGSSSAASSSSASTGPPSAKSKGKQREEQSLRRSSRFLDSESSSSTSFATPSAAANSHPSSTEDVGSTPSLTASPSLRAPARPVVTSSSTDPTDGASSSSTVAAADASDDPLLSPRRRAEQLIERVSMDSLREGPGTAAYVNPLPETTSAPSGPIEDARADIARASNLLSSVLQGLSNPSTVAAARPAPSPPPPQAAPTQPSGGGSSGRGQGLGAIGGGTSLVVQGLVTTSNPTTPPPTSRPSTPTSSSGTQPSSGRLLRPLPSRLARAAPADDGVPQSSPSTAEPVNTSAEDQAALLGGLLSVATTATAASLLRPVRPPSVRPPLPPLRPRTSLAVTEAQRVAAGGQPSQERILTEEGYRRLNAIRDELLRARSAAAVDPGTIDEAAANDGLVESASTSAPTADQAPAANGTDTANDIETVLRNYMTSAFGPDAVSRPENDGAPRDSPRQAPTSPAAPTGRNHSATGPPSPAGSNASSASSSGSGSSTDSSPPMPESFEVFLEDIQSGLLRALREFNGLPPVAAADRADGAAASAVASAASSAGEDRAAPRPSAVNTSAEGEPRRLNWMMVYRFEPRMAPSRSAAPAVGIPADARPSSSSASAAAVPLVDGPLAQVGRALADDPADAAHPDALRRVTPMIMVGVRSIAAADIPAEFGQAAVQSPAPSAAAPASDVLRDALPRPATGAAPRDADGDSTMSDARSGAGLTGRVRRAFDGLRGRTTSDGSPAAAASDSSSTPSAAAPRATDSPDASSAEAQRMQAARRSTASFVLWVVGGQYPDGHPILTAPGLLTGQFTHEDLWALAEVLGNVKPPTASTADIQKSALEVIRGASIPEWVADGRIIASSADRCAVCLEDYEADEDCRVMSCRHVYHQVCVDSWLSTGRNACPSCRTKGVPTADEQKAEAAAEPYTTATAAPSDSVA